jgi:lycopene cyclase domain-containing protein
MTYAVLCAAFVAVALVVALIGWRRAPSGHAWALALSAAVLVVLTAVFDNVMIATGLFGYAEGQISGVRLGLAPVEDFAYPIAAVLLLPAIWNLLGARSAATSTRSEAAGHGGRTRDDARD